MEMVWEQLVHKDRNKNKDVQMTAYNTLEMQTSELVRQTNDLRVERVLWWSELYVFVMREFMCVWFASSTFEPSLSFPLKRCFFVFVFYRMLPLQFLTGGVDWPPALLSPPLLFLLSSFLFLDFKGLLCFQFRSGRSIIPQLECSHANDANRTSADVGTWSRLLYQLRLVVQLNEVAAGDRK